ncbi:MAG TPA: ATP-grasp domain-containing protein [Streptosporangiaceae bacterium]|nr:ATP-grasp domain-containing protein [Streptosporangiaceae bacterium]
MTVIVTGPVSTDATTRFMAACQHNGMPAVLLGTPNPAFTGHPHVSVPTLDLPLAELAGLLAPFGPTAVVPAGELAVPVADRLAAYFGTPHNPLDAGDVYRNKDSMRAAFRAAGLPQPRVHGVFTTMAEAEQMDWSAVPFPVIVKPVDGAGSYFVRLCETPADVLGALPPIFGRARSGATGLSFLRQAVVEEYVDGPEFSAECVVAGGVADVVAVVRKFLSPLPHRDETAHLCADVADAGVLAALTVTIAKVVTAFRVRDTVLHVEFKLTPDGTQHVIEVGNRVAGDQISELVELRSGWDLEAALVRLRSGLGVDGARRGSGSADAYGVKFEFGAPSIGPPQVRTVRRASTDRYPLVEGQGEFHTSQRTGYTILASDDVPALASHLGRLESRVPA